MKYNYHKFLSLAVFSAFLLLPSCNNIVPDASVSLPASEESSSAESSSSVLSSSELGLSSVESSDSSITSVTSEDHPTSYVVRSDNYLNFHITIGEETAEYYYYCEYQPSGLHISIDVIDSLFTRKHSDIGYNDNIEFNIQPICNDTRYSVGNTFNMMVNLLGDTGWFRFATTETSLSGDMINEYINDHHVDYQVTQRIKRTDGYYGASVEINLSYDLWNQSYSDLYGKLTIEPAARNYEVEGNEFRSYVGLGCRYSYAYSAVVINGDGSFSANHGQVSELSSLMASKGLLHNDLELAPNFATMVDNSRAKRFEAGAQLFKDRKYFVSEGVAPRELLGKTYAYNGIASNNQTAIANAGYVVILAPHEGYTDLKMDIIGQGFELVNDIPGKQIGYSSSAIVGITEQSDYYVKWCEVGDTLVFRKWCVVFTKELASYQVLNRWESELAQVHKISSPEALAEYAPSSRLWQGIPGIEWSKRDDGGSRLWASLFSGGAHEPTIFNYTTYYYSDDDGETWDLAFVVDYLGDKNDDSRCFDPSIKYHDGKLYLYWNQTGAEQYTNMACCAIVSNPGIAIQKMSDIENFTIGSPFFCSRGIKMNKPIILTTGEWLYASHDPANINHVEIYSSLDDGLTWSLKGQAKVDNVLFVTESTLVQVDDIGNELVLYSRTDISYYMAVSYSHDGGLTWTDAIDEGRICPNSRQFAYRLASGNIVFAHHYHSYQRENMFIGLSTNGCQSYDHNLIVDDRLGVSYPDITQAEDGSIYMTWDYDRYGMKQVLFTKLTEDELLSINGVRTMDPSLIKEICCIVTTGHTYSVSGYVKDTTGTAIVGAVVTCGNSSATTNEEGYYKVENIDFSNAGSNEIIVHKDGYSDDRGFIQNNDAINYNYHLKRNISLQVIKTASYHGEVVDITDTPLAGVNIKINDEVVATTDNSGEYIISNLEVQPRDFAFELEGYRQMTASVDVSEDDLIEMDTLKMLKTSQCDLGTIGGTNAMAYHLYSERADDGIYFYGVADNDLPNNAQSFEAWINVYGYSKTRSINTSFYRFRHNGTYMASYMPSGTSTPMADTLGMSNVVSGKVMKGYVPYRIIGQYLPEGITVTRDTELAVNFITASEDAKQFDYWQAENIPGINQTMTGQVDKFNSKKYLILKADNTLSANHDEWFDLAAIQNLVANSSANHEGVAFSKANLAETDATKYTQVKGGVMYTDRAASVHGFDDFRLKALDGFTFVASGVLSTATCTVSRSGYVIVLYNAAIYSAPEGFTDIIVNYSNPGLASSPAHALFNYAVMYAEAGQTISAPQSSLIYIN